MAHERFVVVGGGLAGLSSAVALAHRGGPVTLYEQSRRLGGRAATETKQGYSLNLGPHAVYRKGPLYNTLREWQIPFSGKAPQLAGCASLVRGTRKHVFPLNTAGLLMTGALTLPGRFSAAMALRRLATQNPDAAGPIAISDWLDAHVRNRSVRELIEALVRLSTYSNDFARLGATAALRQVQSAIRHGVIYLDGGWETLVTGLSAKAAALGVEIRTGTPVERVEAGGVRLADGHWVGSAGTVLAVTPDSVERLTGVAFPSLAPALAACLDLALRSLPGTAPRFALGLDRPLYFSVHSAAASLAPREGALVQIAKYLRGGEVGTREELEAFADLVLPGWREMAVFTRFLPNMTVSYATPGPRGRPAVNAAGIPGVALAGDWIGDQGMLADAAVVSALRAADFISHRGRRAA